MSSKDSYYGRAWSLDDDELDRINAVVSDAVMAALDWQAEQIFFCVDVKRGKVIADVHLGDKPAKKGQRRIQRWGKEFDLLSVLTRTLGHYEDGHKFSDAQKAGIESEVRAFELLAKRFRAAANKKLGK